MSECSVEIIKQPKQVVEIQITTGPQGPIGPQGVKGDDGTSVNILGEYDTYEDLVADHPTGSSGDGYMIQGHLWVWDGSAWIDVGSIQGPQGEQGDQGQQGIQGATGATGADGKTILSGIVPPTTQGVNGDYYLNTATTVLYGPKAAGVWPNGITLIGAQGATGATGATGEQGTQGVQGVQGPKGDTGATGATGEQGTQGVQGVKGDTGETGAQGIQGVKGDTGQGFNIVKSYISVAALEADTSPTGINSGEFAIIQTGNIEDPENARLYLWDGSVYSFIVDLSGATGIKGDKGDTGDQGVKGDTGETGAQGAQGTQGVQGVKGDNGETGAQGAQGVQGIQGPTGAAGADGKTVLSGTVAPTTEGVNGDFYINTVTSMLYGPKAGGVWPSGVSLIGATGATGSTGATGAAGTNGYSILNGTEIPTTEGVNGDFYLRTTTSVLYGPKTAGAWGSGVSLLASIGTGTTNKLLKYTNGATPTVGDSSIFENSGNVGLNTTTPTAALQIVSTAGFSLPATSGTTPLGVQMRMSSLAATLDFGTEETGKQWIQATALPNLALTYALLLNPNGGDVGIGTASPNSKLEVNGGDACLRLRNTSVAATNYWKLGPNSGNTFLLYNQSDVGMWVGDGGTTWTAGSDINLKKDFLPIENALEKTCSLNGLTFKFKKDSDDYKRRVGVIAQELREVLPEAVTEMDGYLGVNYTDMIPLLIEAVKELSAEKEAMKTRLATIESFLSAKFPSEFIA